MSLSTFFKGAYLRFLFTSMHNLFSVEFTYSFTMKILKSIFIILRATNLRKRV